MLVKKYKDFSLEIENGGITFNGVFMAGHITSAETLADFLSYMRAGSSLESREALQFFENLAPEYFAELKEENLSSTSKMRDAAYHLGADWLERTGEGLKSTREFLSFTAHALGDDICANIFDKESAAKFTLAVAYNDAFLEVESKEYGKHIFSVYADEFESVFNYIREHAERLVLV